MNFHPRGSEEAARDLPSDGRDDVDRSARVEAVLHVDRLETPYLRAGRGRPVLLLGGRGIDDAVWDGLVDRLAERFRVIAPRPEPEAWRRGARWVRELVEGLGLERPAVVAEACLADHLHPAPDGLGPEQLGRVVLLHAGSVPPPTAAVPAWLLHLAVPEGRRPLPGASHDAVARFLDAA